MENKKSVMTMFKLDLDSLEETELQYAIKDVEPGDISIIHFQKQFGSVFVTYLRDVTGHISKKYHDSREDALKLHQLNKSKTAVLSSILIDLQMNSIVQAKQGAGYDQLVEFAESD